MASIIFKDRSCIQTLLSTRSTTITSSYLGSFHASTIHPADESKNTNLYFNLYCLRCCLLFCILHLSSNEGVTPTLDEVMFLSTGAVSLSILDLITAYGLMHWFAFLGNSSSFSKVGSLQWQSICMRWFPLA